MTCEGAGFMQLGTALGMGGMASGMTSLFDFGMEQVAEMQRCRAKTRNEKFLMSRKDLLTHFSPHTPLWMVATATIPPQGKEYDLFAEKLENAWSGLKLEMKTLVQQLLAGDENFNLDDPKTLGWKLDLRQVTTCAAKVCVCACAVIQQWRELIFIDCG